MVQAERQESSYQVHTLYKPPDGIEPTAIIIFFHGLSRGPNEWKDTWLTRGPKNSQVCWPKEWLPKQFGGKVAVLAPAYDASPRGVNDDVKEIGHNLRVSLIRYVQLLSALRSYLGRNYLSVKIVNQSDLKLKQRVPCVRGGYSYYWKFLYYQIYFVHFMLQQITGAGEA